MRSSIRPDSPEDMVYDALFPRCHACEHDPIGPPSCKEMAEIQPLVCHVTIGRKEVNLCEYHAKGLISMLQKQIDANYKQDAHDHEQTCPVCGQKNERHSYYEYGIGMVETHYFCSNCGFAEEMAYSPTYTTFVKGGKLKDRFRRFVVRIKNWKKTTVVRLNSSFSARLGKYI